MKPLERLTMVITLAKRLQSLIEEETEHLSEMKVDRLDQMQEEKQALADAYQMELAALRRDPELLGALSMDVRESFLDTVQDLQKASRRNAAAIDAARIVVDKIVQRIGRCIEHKNAPATGYAPTAGGGQVISVAFNHRI